MWDSVSGGIAYTGGLVGIGTENPEEQLDVAGNAHIGGDLQVEGAIILDSINLAGLLEEILLMRQMAGIGTVSDIDGNIYRTVKIGEQVWMAENLRTSRFAGGTPLRYSPVPLEEKFPVWTGQYCWYDNDSASYEAIYGKIYTVRRDSVCPEGWHIPSLDEWSTLGTYLGDNAGGKMKSVGMDYWNPPNTGATNESGFTGLPGGSLSQLDDISTEEFFFGGDGNTGIWTNSDHNLYSWVLRFNKGELKYEIRDHVMATPIRCIKD